MTDTFGLYLPWQKKALKIPRAFPIAANPGEFETLWFQIFDQNISLGLVTGMI
jgi:hypothetical protein